MKKLKIKNILLCILIIFLAILLGFGVIHLIASPKDNLEPIVELTSVEPETLPTIIPAGDDCVLISWMDSEATTTNLRLVDINKDIVKKSIELKGWWNLRDTVFADGSFLLFDVNNNQFRFLNHNLEKIDEFSPENVNGVFSYDRNNYFFLKEQNLYRTNLENKKTVKVDIPNNLRITNIIGRHPSKDYLALHFALSPYNSQIGTAVFDFNSGKLLMLQDKVFQVDFGNTDISFMEFNEKEMKYSFTYGNEETGFYYAPATLFKNDNNLIPIRSSNYLLSSMGDKNNLYYLGKEIKVSSLKENGIIGNFDTACFLPKKDAIVISGFNNDKCIIYLVRPSKLSLKKVAKAEKAESPLTVSSEIENSYLSEPVLPTNMKDVRDLADKLEKKYGIQILLSSECRKPDAFCGYDFLTTNEMNYSNESQKVAHFLNALDQALSLYPKGFFRQFQNSSGEGGIRFMPVGKLKNDVGIIGVCYEHYEWKNIAVNVDANGLLSLICHEIWHATEYKILASNSNAFNQAEWKKLNPSNFEYYKDAHLLNPNEKKWTLFSANNEGIYFVDDYAKLNENEDRARIMEYIMTKDDFAKEMMKSKAISQKLQLMCDGIRKSFDTTGWSNVRWERFLEKKQ